MISRLELLAAVRSQERSLRRRRPDESVLAKTVINRHFGVKLKHLFWFSRKIGVELACQCRFSAFFPGPLVGVHKYQRTNHAVLCSAMGHASALVLNPRPLQCIGIVSLHPRATQGGGYQECDTFPVSFKKNMNIAPHSIKKKQFTRVNVSTLTTGSQTCASRCRKRFQNIIIEHIPTLG